MKYSRGQTLVEIMVTLAVVIGLSSILVLYTQTGGSITNLNRERQILVTDFRRAQDYALGTRQFSGQTPCGYGIHFDLDATQMILFADLAPADPSCAAANGYYNSGEFVEAITLSRGVKVLSYNASDISFASPAAALRVCPPGPSEGIVTLSLISDESVTMGVKVSSAGAVSLYDGAPPVPPSPCAPVVPSPSPSPGGPGGPGNGEPPPPPPKKP